MKRIGLFAGVFDPIHQGHTYFIEQAAAKNNLDKVYVLIEQEPKFKSRVTPYEHRRRMVELAISKIPKAEIYECEYKFFPITSSLPDIKRANPSSRLFLLLGEDVAEHIGEWRDAEELLKDVQLIIADRKKGGPYSKTSSLKIRQKLKSREDVELNPGVLKYCRDNNLY